MKPVNISRATRPGLYKFVCLVLLVGFCAAATAQVQQKKWYLKNTEVDFTTSTPTVTSGLPGWSAQSTNTELVNGLNDADGNLIFYVNNVEVRNKYGSLIGQLPYANDPVLPEMAIVPVPEEYCRYYIIYSPVRYSSQCWNGLGNRYPLYYSELDMTLNGGNGGFISNGNMLDECTAVGWSTLTVGKLRTGSIRYLYRVADAAGFGQQLQRYTINAGGISGPTTLATFTFSLGAVLEMEISHDGTMLAAANNYGGGSSIDVVIVHLDANGDLDATAGNQSNGLSYFDVTSSSNRMTGVEFSPNSQYLYVGQNDVGIYQLDIGSGTSNFINATGISNYGNSQIELAYDGKIYVTDGTDLGVIQNPNSSVPTATFTAGAVSNVNPAEHSFGYLYYLLPEQLDGQDYDELFVDMDKICCQAIAVPDVLTYTATASATWTSGSNPLNNSSGNVVYIRDELRIPAGKVVTITDMDLYFAPSARVVVEQGTGPSNPGGKLVLDGSLLTADDRCDELDFWQGIEVWGTSSEHQYPSHPYYQGMVELRNGSTIAHARDAVKLFNPLAPGQHGGVVQAYNSSFINNRRSVAFMQYQNFLPGTTTPVRNLSLFQETIFDVDDDYIGTTPFQAHVTLWDVDGVLFEGCTFSNSQSNTTFSPTDNKGIVSIDAGYTIRSGCSYNPPVYPCPSGYIVPSEFIGLGIGVHATGSGTVNTINIDQTAFIDNAYGVEVSRLDNASVTRSTFEIGGNTAAGVPFQYHHGIRLIESTGYRIEENTLEQSSGSVALADIGILVENSGPVNNRIYKNSTVDLTVGEWALGVNRARNDYTGLQILCNIHNNSVSLHYDIIVSVAPPSSSLMGIRTYQGSTTIPAGNHFTQQVATNLFSDYWNNTSRTIRYYYAEPGILPTEPFYRSSNVIIGDPLDAPNICPSNFDSGIRYPLPTGMVAQMAGGYDSAEAAFTNLLYSYNQLIDGGNTTALLEEIQLSWPQDAWNLRDELMEHAPYLSQEILMSAAESDVLPHAMMLEICLANPEGTFGNDFLDFLRYDIPSPMPEYMVEMIEANWDSSSARTLLEMGLAYHSDIMAFNADVIMANIKLDSIRNLSAIQTWLQRRATLADMYALAESYLSAGNFSTISGILDDIEESSLLDDDYLSVEYSDYVDYMSFRNGLHTEGKTIAGLDSNEVVELHYFAENSVGRSSTMAWSILCFFYDICPDNLIEFPEDPDAKRPVKRHQVKAMDGNLQQIRVFPNPAGAFTTLYWNLPAGTDRAVLRITDVTGKEVLSRNINGQEGQWAWDTRKVPQGIYLCEIREDNKQLGSTKIVVNK